MILRNYYNLMKQLVKSAATGSLNPNIYETVQLSNGSVINIEYAMVSRGKFPLCTSIASFTSSNIFTTLPGTSARSWSTITIVFGNNDTPPNIDDYTTNAISGITFNSYTINGSEVELIFQNTLSSDITIRDYVLFGSACGDSTSKLCALVREVFDEPIIVPSKGYFTFTLTKTFGEQE